MWARVPRPGLASKFVCRSMSLYRSRYRLLLSLPADDGALKSEREPARALRRASAPASRSVEALGRDAASRVPPPALRAAHPGGSKLALDRTPRGKGCGAC